MRKVITILLTVVVLLSVICMVPRAKAAGNYTIRLAGADGSNVVSAKPGDTVKLILSLENNPGVLSVGVQVSYPSGLSIAARPNDVSGFSSIATVYKTFSPTLSSNPYLLWWNMPLGNSRKGLVTKEGNIAQITFKVAADAQSGDYNITLTAPPDKNLTASVSGGVITPDTNTDVTGISLAGCTVRVENLCAQGHSYGAWSDAGNGKHSRICSVCGTLEAAEHAWDDGTVIQKPTCKDEGISTYLCTTCQATKTETVEKKEAHTYDNTCDADCNVCGETHPVTHQYGKQWRQNKTEHWYQCAVCGDKKDRADHVPGPEATKTEPQKCTVCDYVIEPALTHACEYGDIWNMDETGHWRICTECGNKSDTAAHEPGAEAAEEAARICHICGYEIVPPLEATEPETANTEESTAQPGTDGTAPSQDGQTSSMTKTILLWCMSILFVAGAATLTYILIRKKKNTP